MFRLAVGSLSAKEKRSRIPKCKNKLKRNNKFSRLQKTTVLIVMTTTLCSLPSHRLQRLLLRYNSRLKKTQEMMKIGRMTLMLLLINLRRRTKA